MKRAHLLAFVALMAVAPAGVGVAGADDADDLTARMTAAMSKVKSFAISISGANDLSGDTVVVKPDLSSSVLHVSGVTVEVVAQGFTSYVRINGSPWRPQKSNAAQLKSMLGPLIDATRHVTLLPDRVEDGVAVGAFSYEAPPIQAELPLPASTGECTYDKKTFLPKVCTTTFSEMNMVVVQTYGKWNDPSNSVTIPTNNVASPVPAVIPSGPPPMAPPSAPPPSAPPSAAPPSSAPSSAASLPPYASPPTPAPSSTRT